MQRIIVLLYFPLSAFSFPHGLRHAFATDLIRNGAPVQDVSEMLGHVKLETTPVYTRLAALDLKKHHKEHHPRA